MFRKLRIKLTLINIGIVMAILLVVFAFVFLSMRTTLKRQVGNIKKMIESGATTFPDSGRFFPRNTPQSDGVQKIFGGVFIVIEADDNGLISSDNPGFSVTQEEKQGLYDLVKNNDKNMKYIQFEDSYFITFFVVSETTKYYFIDATQERELMASTAKEFLLILLLAVIMVLIGNLIMTKKALEPVKKSYDKQKQFVGDASHELRTPLSAIKTNMEIISEDDEKTVGEHRKWIDNVNHETDRMSDLVNKLLFLSRKDNMEQDILYEVINIAEEIETTIKAFDLKFRQKGIEFEHCTLNTYVKADRLDIHQLVSSILDNAYKYTEKGKVSLKLFEENSYAVLEVSDTGTGIRDEDKNKVFERFYRTDQSRSSKNMGYGLGLSIVKSIVENYKGKIELVSAFGEGSTFIVKIPTVEKKGRQSGK
ncbi:MAG: HAMP domain-containing histidine kinase [Clostridia bacterium]|nr:HAMP domain-containing histidine kinase [Clostridia bacterium]